MAVEEKMVHFYNGEFIRPYKLYCIPQKNLHYISLVKHIEIEAVQGRYSWDHKYDCEADVHFKGTKLCYDKSVYYDDSDYEEPGPGWGSWTKEATEIDYNRGIVYVKGQEPTKEQIIEYFKSNLAFTKVVTIQPYFEDRKSAKNKYNKYDKTYDYYIEGSYNIGDYVILPRNGFGQIIGEKPNISLDVNSIKGYTYVYSKVGVAKDQEVYKNIVAQIDANINIDDLEDKLIWGIKKFFAIDDYKFLDRDDKEKKYLIKLGNDFYYCTSELVPEGAFAVLKLLNEDYKEKGDLYKVVRDIYNYNNNLPVNTDILFKDYVQKVGDTIANIRSDQDGWGHRHSHVVSIKPTDLEFYQIN